MENYNRFLKSKDKNYDACTPSDIDIKKTSIILSDKEYLQFLLQTNGGFFFYNSLHLYSLCEKDDYSDIFNINKFFRAEYAEILNDEFFFGQDVFGNQFGFYSSGILFFNIETGEKTHLTEGFNGWVDLIMGDIEYYTGCVIAEQWSKNIKPLDYEERLCPKIPFVTGGDYEIENLYNSSFPKYILTNSNIAKQIYNLPDGTSINIVVTK